ncbi:MAG: hypothetical protein D6706_13610 [Chloroflexi bacterium]|nr:MAG: hypothetical protein D6706_13610 [Chloroflexota bacterium]
MAPKLITAIAAEMDVQVANPYYVATARYLGAGMWNVVVADDAGNVRQVEKGIATPIAEGMLYNISTDRWELIDREDDEDDRWPDGKAGPHAWPAEDCNVQDGIVDNVTFESPQGAGERKERY